MINDNESAAPSRIPSSEQVKQLCEEFKAMRIRLSEVGLEETFLNNTIEYIIGLSVSLFYINCILQGCAKQNAHVGRKNAYAGKNMFFLHIQG